jgi:hypothetical protein
VRAKANGCCGKKTLFRTIELKNGLVLLLKELFGELTEWAEMDKAGEQTTMLCCGKRDGFVADTDTNARK